MRRMTDDPPRGGQARSTSIAIRTSVRPSVAEELDRLPASDRELLYQHRRVATDEAGAHPTRLFRVADDDRREPFAACLGRSPRAVRLEHAGQSDVGHGCFELGQVFDPGRARHGNAERAGDLDRPLLAQGDLHRLEASERRRRESAYGVPVRVQNLDARVDRRECGVGALGGERIEQRVRVVVEVDGGVREDDPP